MSNTSLKADSAGFLIGGQSFKPSGAELSMLRSVRDDVKAIRKILEDRKKSAGTDRGKAANDEAKGMRGGAVSAKQVIATPSGRAGASGTTQKTVKTVSIDRVKDAAEIRARTNKPMVIAMPVARGGNRAGNRSRGGEPAGVGRDSAGRFVGGSGVGGSGSVDATSKTMGLLSDIKDGIGNVVNLSGGDEVDPVIKAAHEVQGIAVAALSATKAVGSVVAPIGRSLFSKNTDTKLPFLRRIFAEIRGLRREESVFNKAQLRTLNRIDGKETPTQGGGSLGMIGTMLMAALGPLMMMLTKLPLVGPILSKLGGIAPLISGPKIPTTTVGKTSKIATAAEGASSLAGSTGMAAKAAEGGGLLSKAATGAKGLLKRVPILGAALATIGAGAEVYGVETDDKLSRAEKDKKTGAAIGGGVGTIGGMMGGAAAGAAIGALGGPIGIAIGGVVGGAAGAFFGEDAGKVIGETVGGWVTELRNADIPGKILNAWNSVISIFTDVLKRFGVDLPAAANQVKNSVKNSALDASIAAKSGRSQATGEAIKLTDEEANRERQKYAAADPRRLDGGTRGANDSEGSLVNGVARGAGWLAGKSSMGAGWMLDQFKGDKRKAAETAQSYSAGNIAGLDDAQTRALVASTVLTESSGGKLDAMNKQGYMGRYQAGASWLSSAGLMRGGDKAVKDAMKTDGFTNEWKWAESGGMTRYLSNDKNWVDGMSRSKYLASAGAQDAAFKTVNDKTYEGLVKRGVIKPGDSPEVVAGYLKTAHIGGVGGAVEVSKGGQGASDANGTSARKYFDDMASDRHGFNQVFKNSEQAPVTTASPVNVAPVNVTAANIPKVEASVPALRIPDMPAQTKTPIYSSAPAVAQATPTVVVFGGKQMAGRDISIRPIAHVATGGLSGSS